MDDYENEDPTWGCLDRPAPALPSPGPFDVTIHVHLFGDPEGGVAEADVTLCPKIDPDCVTPIDKGITDPDGNVTFTVSGGFEGYVSMFRRDEMLAEGDQLLPTFYYLNPAINSDQLVIVQTTKLKLVDTLTQLLEVQQEASRGILLLNAFDCNNARAPGIVFESDALDVTTRPFFSIDGVPDLKATRTDQSGFGGFLNATLGFTHFSAHVFENERTLDTVGLTVRAGVLTQTRMVPSRWAPPIP